MTVARAPGDAEMETHVPEALCHPPEEAKLFNYYLFNNYFLWRTSQGLFKPPLSAGGDKVRTILDTVKISAVICNLVPQEQISWYLKNSPQSYHATPFISPFSSHARDQLSSISSLAALKTHKKS